MKKIRFLFLKLLCITLCCTLLIPAQISALSNNIEKINGNSLDRFVMQNIDDFDDLSEHIKIVINKLEQDIHYFNYNYNGKSGLTITDRDDYTEFNQYNSIQNFTINILVEAERNGFFKPFYLVITIK